MNSCLPNSDKPTIKERIRRKSNFMYRQTTSQLRMLPSFIIFGCHRCGTTSMYQYLIKHPSILPALTKEIGFFNGNFHRGINWYKAYFPLIHKNISKNEFSKFTMTGEADPSYVHHPKSPKRIKDSVPNIKLILMLRNPIDRALSQYWKSVKLKRENLSFSEAIDEEPKRLEGEREKMLQDENYYSKNYHYFSYLTAGIYVKTLKHWLKYFPKKQILIIKSEDFYQNPKKIYEQTLNYLQLPSFSLDNFRRWDHYDDLPKMDNDIKKKLHKFFKPYNEELYSLVEKNFDWDK